MADGPLSVNPDFHMPDWMWFAKWVFEGAHLTELYLQNEISESIHLATLAPKAPTTATSSPVASTIDKTYATLAPKAPHTAAPQVYYMSAGSARGQWFFGGDELDIDELDTNLAETIRNLNDEQRYQLAISRSKRSNNQESIHSAVNDLLSRKLSQIVSSTRRNKLPPLTQRLGVAMLTATTNPSDSTWSTIESDNHADTWCFGPNFIMDGYTGQVCDVSGFDHEVKNKEIRIGTGLTIFEDPETGNPRLLQVDQGLDFTEILDHTLANPNQSRVFGINWCDDAWDPNQPFGIQLEENILIPFNLSGSSAIFKTRTPTSTEIQQLFDDRIILTSNQVWEPYELKPPNDKAFRSKNITALQLVKDKVSFRSIQVCETLERDTGYIADYGDS